MDRFEGRWNGGRPVNGQPEKNGRRNARKHRSVNGFGRRAANLATPENRSAGNAPMELLILAPVVLLLVSLVIAAGRTALAQNSVNAAARDAARQASIARSSWQARAAARSAAIADLAGQGLRCAPASVSVRLAGFAVPAGQPASVSATVTCRVRLADLLIPGTPGGSTLSATFSSPLDPYRGRTVGAGYPAPAAGGIS